MMALASNQNISQVKIGRLTQPSILMLRNIKLFWKIEFTISECEDEVFEDTESDEEMNNEEAGEHEVEEEKFDEKKEKTVKMNQLPKTFIFSCLGVNMTNYARKTE